MAEQAPAVVLLSGGLDSATTLAVAQAAGFAVHALTFRYGQRHAVEVNSAALHARLQEAIEHRLGFLGFRAMAGSPLSSALALAQSPPAVPVSPGHPSAYVPARHSVPRKVRTILLR